MRYLRFIIIVLTGFSFISFAGNATNKSVNKVAYYPMNNAMNDESGNKNHGIAKGVNPHTDISGQGIGSYRFNNGNDLITLPIDVNKTSLTVCFWVYFERLGSDYGIATKKLSLLENKKGDGHGLWLGLNPKNGKNGFWAISSEGAHKVFVSSKQVVLKEWVFVAVSIDRNKNKCVFYINDQKINAPVSIKEGKESLNIGCHWGDNKNDEYYIDEVSVYNKALSTAEISAIRQSVDVFDSKKEREAIAKFDYFIVKVDSTRVKTGPNVDTPHLGFVYQGDTISNGTVCKNEGRGYYKWLKIKYKEQTGYLIMANLKRENAFAQKTLNKTLFNKLGFHDKKNWIILVICLLVAYILGFKFSAIDGLLSVLSRKNTEGGTGLIVFAGFIGAVLGLVNLIWSNQANYLFQHPTFLPLGHGFGAWLIMLCLALLALNVLGVAITSLINFGILHALLRIPIIIALAAFTFVGSLIISMVAVILTIGIVFALIYFKAAITPFKYVRIYPGGRKEVFYQ